MPSLPQRFGRVVRKRRELAGFSQEGFAASAKIDRTYYSKIERGRANVSLLVIERLTKALRVTAAELFADLDRE